MNCIFCKYKVQTTKKILNYPICNNCYDKFLNIKCSCCLKEIKYDQKYYLKYPDFKNVFKNPIDVIAHWIKFGYKEQRCISANMKWKNNNIICNSCLIPNTNIKKNVLIAFCQPEWNSGKLKTLYDFLVANYDNNLYHFVVYNFIFPNGFGYSNINMINISNISSIYDILILGNNYNQVHYNQDWYNICIDMLKLNKKIGILNSTYSGDFYCPSGYTNNEGIHQCIMLREMNYYKDEHYHLLENIILFLPRCHYFQDCKQYFFGLNDSNYHPDAYKNFKKILLDPIKINNVLSKKEFFNYYNIPMNKKIIAYYPAIFSQVFWKGFSSSHPALKTVEDTAFKEIGCGYWELSEIQRLFFYNLNFIADLISKFNYVLMIKIHPENHHYLWGNNCFRDDIDDKSSDPINYIDTSKIKILNNDHNDELYEYIDKVIITSDTSSAHPIVSFNIPIISFTDKKYDWIKYCVGGLRYENLYGDVTYTDEIFDENNKLNKENLTNKFTNFFNKNIKYQYSNPKKVYFKKTTLKKQFDIILNNLK